AGWSKCLGPRVCEAGRVYLLRDRAQVGTHSHPGRVLLRGRWQGLVFAVGAPPDRRTAPVRTAKRSEHRLASWAGTIRTRGGCSYGFAGGFCCRSTAPGANRSRHKLAPRAGPIRTRGGCSYGFAGGFGFVVGAPPRREPRTRRAQICVTGRPPFAPRAGAPSGSGGHVVVFCCRSTASVRTANEAGTDWRLGQVPIRTRGGCSYGFAGGFGFCCMTIHFRRVSYMWRVLAEHANN